MKTHGLSRTPLYRCWASIKQRCYDETHPAYKHYGGRGITLYEEWIDNPVAFISYLERELGEKPSPGHSLDRRDNNEGYKPGNLRWATGIEQNNNRRNGTDRKPRKRGYKKAYAMSERELGESGYKWVNRGNKKVYTGKFKYLGEEIYVGTHFDAEVCYQMVLDKREEMGLPIPE